MTSRDDPRYDDYELCCSFPGGQFEPTEEPHGCEQIFATTPDPDGIIRNPDLAGYVRRSERQ